jgi:hypothetical protein
MSEAIMADAALLDHDFSPVTLATRQLWSERVPGWADDQWRELSQDLIETADEDWQVWIDWHDARVEGRAPNQMFELAIAAIPNELWQRGPKFVNAHLKQVIEENPDDQPPDPKKQEAFERWPSRNRFRGPS